MNMTVYDNKRKSIDISKENKKMIEENNNADEKLSKEVLIIAQEVKIVKALSCNNATKRSKQIRKLHKWLKLRTHSSINFTKDDFMRIWKGLYYCMWYSDKPLVQEELAEQLGQLLNCFDPILELSINFFGAFLETMSNEWFGIDQWRIDKFLMLVRRMLRYMFKVLQKSKWSLNGINKFNETTTAIILKNDVCKGLCMHYLDIFFEELAKVSEGDVSSEEVNSFLQPFIGFIALQKDEQLLSHCRTRVFYHLLYQSRLGRDYSEKYDAWKSLGFPSKNIDDLEKIGDDDDGENEGNIEDSGDNKKYLDPRAGNVDVYMPELPLDGKYVSSELEYYIFKHDFPTKRRKMLRRLLEIFQTYQNGTFPLGVKTMPRFEVKKKTPLIKEKIQELDDLENELFGVNRKLKQLNKRKRRKLLKSLNFEDLDENNFEQSIEKALPKLKRKTSSLKAMISGWLEEELDESELPAKQSKNINDKYKPDFLIEKKSNKKKTNKKLKAKSHMNLNKLRIIKTHQDKRITENSKELKFELNQQNNSTKNHSEIVNDIASDVETNGKNVSLKSVEENTKSANATINKLFSDDSKQFNPTDDWGTPLKEGEVELFIPSRKLKLKKVNTSIGQHSTPLRGKRMSISSTNTSPAKPTSAKRVRIALKHNTTQHPLEYIQQIRSSPNVPFDANKKPSKGVLKPNSTPSPINPFYKKKIGLKLNNDTF